MIYYAAIIMYYLVRGNLSTFNVGGMLKTFSLQTGWYVWVMRVFLITALVAPFIKMMSEKSMKWTTIAVLMAILICYEFLHIDNNDSIGYYLSMTIPYIVIFTMGMIVNRFGRKEQFAMAILLMLIFAIEGIFVVRENGEFLCTNNYKNPPLLYFTSFGLGCSMLFWMLKDSIYKLAKKVKVDRIMAFIGSHTMWYYLLHIPVIMLAIHFPIGKIMQFVFTLVVTTAITYLFVQIIEKKIIPRIKSDVAKKNIKLIFLG